LVVSVVKVFAATAVSTIVCEAAVSMFASMRVKASAFSPVPATAVACFSVTAAPVTVVPLAMSITIWIAGSPSATRTSYRPGTPVNCRSAPACTGKTCSSSRPLSEMVPASATPHAACAGSMTPNATSAPMRSAAVMR
jgi:hypothetical protein